MGRELLLLLAFVVARVTGQELDQSLAFEVASIKRVLPQAGGVTGRGIRIDRAMLSGRASLQELVAEAYGIEEALVSGGPAWAAGEIYAIEARTAIPEAPERLRLILQALLAQRFNLKLHREPRRMSYYALVEGKGGVKASTARAGDDRPFGHHGGALHLPSLAAVARRMSGVCRCAVMDQSGVQGIDITIAIESVLDQFPGERPNATAIRDAYFASLVRGVEALGLRVESQKGLLEVIVIDSASRPTEN